MERTRGIHIKQEWMYMPLALMLSVASILTEMLHMGAVSYIVNALFVVLALLGDKQVTQFYIAVALPNTKCLTLFGVSDVVIICFLSVVLRYLVKKKLAHDIVVLSVLHVFLGLTVLIRYSNITYGIVFPIKMLAVLLHYYCYADDLINEPSVSNIQRDMKLWIVAYGMGILAAFAPSAAFSGGEGRLYVAGNDPNILAVEAVFVLAFTAVLFFRTQHISGVGFSMLLISMSLVCVLSGSRMGLILLGGTICLTVLLNLKHIGKNLWLLGLLALGGVILLSSSYGQNMLETLRGRTNAMMDRGDISNGRFDLWLEYIQTLNNHPICWLFGMGDYRLLGLDMQAHNMILEDIAAYGLVGMFFLYWIYWKIYSVAKTNIASYGWKTGKTDLFMWLPVLVVLGGNIVLRTLTNVINTSMLLMGAFLPHALVTYDSKRYGSL